MNKYALFPTCLFCLLLVFACSADGSETTVKSGKNDVLGTNNTAEMSQEMKNMNSAERQTLDKIAELQKKAIAANKDTSKKKNPNEVTYLIGDYDNSDKARAIQEDIYRIQYKIKPVLSRIPGGLKVMATCRFKDKAELAKMESELKSKFGEGVRLMTDEEVEATKG